MRKYNRALDYAAVALAAAVDGDMKRAFKAFAKAVNQTDTIAAVQIIEASNAEAFKAQASASTKTTAAAKAPKATAKVLAFHLGDDVDSVLDDESTDAEDDVVEAGDAEELEDVADDSEDESEDDMDFEAEFAKVMASMELRRSKAKRK